MESSLVLGNGDNDSRRPALNGGPRSLIKPGKWVYDDGNRDWEEVDEEAVGEGE